MPRSGSHSDIAADVVTVIVRLPAAIDEPAAEHARGQPAEAHADECQAEGGVGDAELGPAARGAAAIHDENVAPLTKNTAPIASAAAPGRGRAGGGA